MIEAGQVFGIGFTGEIYAAMVGKTTPECGVMLRELFGERMFPLTLGGIDKAMAELKR